MKKRPGMAHFFKKNCILPLQLVFTKMLYSISPHWRWKVSELSTYCWKICTPTLECGKWRSHHVIFSMFIFGLFKNRFKRTFIQRIFVITFHLIFGMFWDLNSPPNNRESALITARPVMPPNLNYFLPHFDFVLSTFWADGLLPIGQRYCL